MRFLKTIITSIFVLVMVFFLFYVPDIKATGMTVVPGAHRGNSLNYTENSILAIYDATTNPKYDFIEFDVQYTKDKVPVIYHDLTLTRVHKLPFTISSLSLNELRKLSHNTIPTFDEVMNVIGHSKKMIIEIKPSFNEEKDIELVKYVLNYSDEHGLDDNIVISSMSKDVVKYVSKEHSNIPTGLIYWIYPVTYLPFDNLVTDLYDDVEETGADYLMMHGVNARNQKLIELKPDDVTLVFWYFNDHIFVLKNETEGNFSW